MKAYITEQAWQDLIEEMVKYPMQETAAILVGELDSGIVRAVIPFGEHAKRCSVHVAADWQETDALQKVLNEYQRQGLDYLGTSHKHPPDCHHFSGTDKLTFKEQLSDSDYKKGPQGFFFYPLFVPKHRSHPPVSEEDFTVYWFIAYLDEQQRLQLEKRELEIIKDEMSLRCLILDSLAISLASSKKEQQLFGVRKQTAKRDTFFLCSTQHNGKSIATFTPKKPKKNSQLPVLFFRKDTLILRTTSAETEAISIPFQTDYTKRIAGIVNPTLLKNKTVLIVGVGSFGSTMAVDLVRAGVGRIVAIDPDVVSASNICRCVFTALDIGLPKVEVLGNIIEEINPLCLYEGHLTNVLDMGGVMGIREFLTQVQPDAVAILTDTPSANLLMNAAVYPICPGVYASAYPGASGGDIIFTLPPNPKTSFPGTSCYECVLGGVLAQETVPVRGSWDYGRTDGQLLAAPGLGVDIQNIVLKSTKIVLALLMQEEKTSQLAKLVQRKENLLFVGNDPMNDFLFTDHFQNLWSTTEVVNDCGHNLS